MPTVYLPVRTTGMILRIAITLLVVAESVVAWNLLAGSSDTLEPVGECLPEGVDPGYTVGRRVTPPEGLAEVIEAASHEFHVDPWMLTATIHRESGCDQYALGSSGEIGLAQVNPSVWMPTLRRKGIAKRPQELYNVRANLRAAAFVLHRMHVAANGDVFGIFRRYNGSGPKARQYAREQVHYYTTLASSHL